MVETVHAYPDERDQGIGISRKRNETQVLVDKPVSVVVDSVEDFFIDAAVSVVVYPIAKPVEEKRIFDRVRRGIDKRRIVQNAGKFGKDIVYEALQIIFERIHVRIEAACDERPSSALA